MITKTDAEKKTEIDEVLKILKKLPEGFKAYVQVLPNGHTRIRSVKQPSEQK